MIFLRSLAFNAFFLLWTVGLGILALPLLLAPWRWVLALARFWIGGTLFMLRVLCGIRAEVRGLEHVPSGPVIFASKHQSAWETLYWFRLYPNVAFVFKKELARIPFFGWYLSRAGQIMVDRGGGAKALKSLLTEADRVKGEGRPIVIFPEGTRTAPGETRPLQRGIAAIYKHTRLPVVPVMLDSGNYWGKNAFRKMPGTIRVEFLPAIAPGNTPDALMLALEQALGAAAAPQCP